MVSRLLLSLRKAADEGNILCWNQGNLSVGQWNGTNQEMSNLHFRSRAAVRDTRTEDITM